MGYPATVTTIPAYVARTQLGSILKALQGKRAARFIITKGGKPVACMISPTDLDDILEELDPEFQKSLKLAHKEYQAGKTITLHDYMKKKIRSRRAG